MSVRAFFFWSILLIAPGLSGPAFGLSTRTESWSEDVAFHDGRVIKVAREVDYNVRLVAENLELFTSAPDQFSIRFKHPDTQESIRWQGLRHFVPTMLEIVGGVPYLVLFGSSTRDSEKTYGCQEMPYVFLKYEKGLTARWVVVPAELAPAVLRDANLSPRYPDFPLSWSARDETDNQIHNGRSMRDLSRDQVLQSIEDMEASSVGRFQAKVPRGYDTWHYPAKNGYRTERRANDCRPPFPLPKPATLPPAKQIVLETVETKNFDPDQVFPQSKWAEAAFDGKRRGYCASLIKPRDQAAPLLGEFFVQDSSRQKNVPYAGFDLRSGAQRLCDRENIWFYAHLEEPGKLLVTRYSAAGDLVYRVSFPVPPALPGYTGYVMAPTIQSDGAYLYLEWWQFKSVYVGQQIEWRVRQAVRARFKEPATAIAAAEAREDKKQFERPAPARPPITARPTTFQDCPACPIMVVLPGKNYAIGKYEVSQAEWKAMTGEVLPVAGANVEPNKPMIYRSWDRVQKYIERLNTVSGKNYRLPTETEWEHACYGGRQTQYCGGDDVDAVAWYGKARGLTQPGGTKQANDFGIHDMSGNVWEWVDGCWKGNCALRIARGGSVRNHPLAVGDAYVYGISKGRADIGFRLVRDLP